MVTDKRLQLLEDKLVEAVGELNGVIAAIVNGELTSEDFDRLQISYVDVQYLMLDIEVAVESLGNKLWGD